MMEQRKLEAGVRWLLDYADAGGTQVGPSAELLREMAAIIERDIAATAQMGIVDGAPMVFHNGQLRLVMSPEKSDSQVAGEIRMLTPADLSPEAILKGKPPLEYWCVLARDRILSLSQRLHATLARLDRLRRASAAAAAPSPETVTFRPGSVEDPERDRLFNAIQQACAGGKTGSVLAAQIDCLAGTIAFAAADHDNAKKIIADTASDLTRGVADNWESIKAQACDVETCVACAKPFEDGDRFYAEKDGGFIHAACCGPEREGYFGSDGEPLKDGDPIPTPHVWGA